MSRPAPTYSCSQLENPPSRLQAGLVDNRLFIVAIVRESREDAPPTLIAYDALRTQLKQEPVYCVVRMLQHGPCRSWQHRQRPLIQPLIHEEEHCFLVLDPIELGPWFRLDFSQSQGLVYLKEIGEGAQGIVYLTHDLRRSTPTRLQYSAVKILEYPRDRQQLIRQENEIRFHLRASVHPNVVTLHRVYRQKQHYFLVMDYHSGSDLDSFITENPSVYLDDNELIRSIILQLLDVIWFLHEHGVYHCDIKPGNIFVSKDGSRLFLGDFGFATKDKITHRNNVCGTISYMSPETFLEKEIPNEHGDRWAIGVTILNLVLAGILPWERAIKKSPEYEVVDLHYDEFYRHPTSIRERFPISKEFGRFIREVLHPIPSKRKDLASMKAAITIMPRFLMTPEELKRAAPEAREVAMNIGLLPEPDMTAEALARLEGSTAYASSDSDSALVSDVYTKTAALVPVPIRKIDRALISSGTRAVLDRHVGVISVNSSPPSPISMASPTVISSASPPLASSSEASDSDTDGPETPETLPVVTVQATVANLSADEDIPDIENAMAGDQPITDVVTSLHANKLNTTVRPGVVGKVDRVILCRR